MPGAEHFEYDVLAAATDGFSAATFLGHGAFARVYRGYLPEFGMEET